jgi:hypothetical protein
MARAYKGQPLGMEVERPGVADFARYRNYVVARILAGTLSAMNRRFPEPPADVRRFAERELESAG